jgi:hypothetical protein
LNLNLIFKKIHPFTSAFCQLRSYEGRTI